MPSHDDLSAGPTRTGSPCAPAAPPTISDRTPTIQPAERVARFHVLGCIGTGGMGQVYAAYDPELDRKVALKVLHEGREQGEQPRLIREAQALARLSHPNVVAVHDVGTHRGRLFVAMEFVEGVTLREWLRLHAPGSPRHVTEVLELLIQAGEGLAAAHRAGLVHRDFKPSNVLIGNDGRVRVVDFGVVRVEEPGEGSRPQHLGLVGEEETTEPQLESLEPVDPLTRPGAIVGTPAYMAPEQLVAMKVGPSSDLFSFCLTAWEAIFGVRPFPGKTIPAVLEAIRRGQPVRPTDVECPRELEAALLEGLSFGSRARQSSMDVLLDALRLVQARLRGEAPPASPPVKRWPWLGAVLLAGAAATAGLMLARERSQLCSGAEDGLAGVWDDAIATKLEQAFLRTEASFAAEAWARFERELDGYAQAWVDGHRDACEAAQVRKEQSTELMDLRMACLDARRRELAALTEVYATVDTDMLARTDEALEELDSVDACADLEHVRRRGSTPEGSQAAAEAEAVLEKTARSSALKAAGQYVEALETASEAVARANELDMAVVTARAYLQLGKVHMTMHQGESAREALEWAYLLAKRADVPEVAFEASRALVQVTGVLLSRFPEGRWWSRVARFEAETVDDENELARLQVALGGLARVEGRFQDASDHYEDAVALLRRSVGPTHLAYADALAALGSLRVMQGGPDRALPLLDEAMAVAEHELGPEHPSMARFHLGHARAHRLRGDLDLALRHVDRALRLNEDAFGPTYVALLEALQELAHVLHDRGEYDRAIAALERARSLTRPEPPNEVKLASLLALEGEISFQQQDFRRAEQAFRRAEELSRSAVGDFNPQTARIRVGLGAALSALGRRQEGSALIEAGLAAGEVALGGQHPNVAVIHDMLAAERKRAGDFEKALEHIEKALQINAAAYGDDAFPLLHLHGNMCAVLGHLRRTDEAVEHCHKALKVAERAVSFDEGLVAALHNNLGAALVAAQRYDEATPHYRDARRIWERLLGPRHVMVGMVLANLAETSEASGQLTEAYDAYAESLAIREERLGPDDPMVIVPLVGMANVATRRGEPQAAIALARRAVEVARKGSAPELVLARAEEALAHALWEASEGRTEAVELASRARRAFEQAGAPAEVDRARLARWLPTEREDRR